MEEEPDLPEPFDAEIEHRAPADPGDASLLRAPGMLWIAGDDVLASIALSTSV